MTKSRHLRIVKEGETASVSEVVYAAPDPKTGFRPMVVGPEAATPPEVPLHERIDRIKASIKRIQDLMSDLREPAASSVKGSK